MRAGAHTFVDRVHYGSGMVLEELPHALRIHRRYVEVHRMADIDSIADAAAREIAKSLRRAGRDDHLASMHLGYHVTWQFPGALREARKAAPNGEYRRLAGGGWAGGCGTKNRRQEPENTSEGLPGRRGDAFQDGADGSSSGRDRAG